MRAHIASGLLTGGLSALLLGTAAQAQEGIPEPAALQSRIDQMQRQLEEQRMLINALARELAVQRDAMVRRGVRADERQTGEDPMPGQALIDIGGAASPAQLGVHRGAGQMENGIGERVGPTERVPDAVTTAPAGQRAGNGKATAAGKNQVAAGSIAPPDAAPGPARTPPQAGAVGRPPASNGRPPEVAPLFEQPGVLTPKGKFVFEPTLQFGYSSSNRVALVGYTVIPALLIGLVDVREIKRNTSTLILGGRTGVSKRFEIDAKIPYVYRSDATVSREIFTGTAVENVFSTSGKAIGDAEIGLRYQLNSGGVDKPFYVGSLRIKSRTGRDPFSVVTDCTRRCTGPNATGTGLPLDLPTGSGFYSVQPGLTWLFPSDPAVFFGSVSYLHNFKRSNVSRTVLGGEKEWLGDIEPGGIVGFNFGMGLGLNEKASLSLGYDHSSIGRTRQDGRTMPGSVRTQLGTLLLGYSYRISERRSLNVSVGAGLTRDTPDVSLTVRLPTTF